MRTHRLLIFLLYSVVVNGQDQDIKIDARYTTAKCIEIEVKNLTNNKVSIVFAQQFGEMHSGINLTFIQHKKDTIDSYFEPLYNKYILRLPSQSVYKKQLCIWDIPGGSKCYDGGKTVVDVDVFIDYCVYTSPPQYKSTRRKFRFGEYKKLK